MFRNWDNWDVYYDRDGNRLSGCVQFNLKDGTTPAAIFDGDGTPIANPVLTDSMGRTERQVFVRSDVLAYFYRYVGQGSLADEEVDGIDPSDESKWALQYTVESAAIDERSVSGESAMGVGTIDELRAIDPGEVPEVDGAKIVCLHGYFTAGDKEPVWYVWYPQSVKNDDNGSVIQPDGVLTGRWIMVPPSCHCDSRHFGIFPQDSQYAEIDQTTQIGTFIDYCNVKSLHPYFNGSQSAPYFIYTSIAVESANPIVVSDGTQFVDKGTGNRFYGEWEGNPYFVNHLTQVKCATAKHSWFFGSMRDVVNYIIDTDNRPAILTGVNVVMTVSPASGVYLTGCTVESVHKIDKAISLSDMEVKESWFADGYDWSDLSVYGCDIVLDNFSSADTYVTLKNKQNEADYGDLGEQQLTGATFLDNAIAENFSGTATCRGSVEIHNASATLTFTGSTPSLNAIDSWLTVSAGGPFDTLAIRRGQIISPSTVSVLTACRLDDVDIDAPLSILGGRLDCIGCRINQAISHIGDPVVENVRGCVFNAQLQVRGGGTDVVVNAVWQDNVGNVATPIAIDKANLALLDSAHSYTYSGNSGTFLASDHAKFTATLNFTDNFVTATQNNDYIMSTKDSTDAPPSAHFRNDASYENQNPGFNHGFSGTVSIFRIGRDAFPVRVDWRILSTSAAQMPQLTYNLAPVSFRMLMVYSSGMEWNCYVYKAAYSAQGSNTYDTNIAIGLLNFAMITNVSITGAFEAVR